MNQEMCDINAENDAVSAEGVAVALGIFAGQTYCLAGDIEYCTQNGACWLSQQSRGQRYCPIIDRAAPAEDSVCLTFV